MQHNYFIYILTNRTNKLVYIGVTNDLRRRIYEHKNKLFPGFTRKYNLNKLVYFERYQNIDEAILREKRLKKWKRSWKDDLIKKENPDWNDLYSEVVNW